MSPLAFRVSASICGELRMEVKVAAKGRWERFRYRWSALAVATRLYFIGLAAMGLTIALQVCHAPRVVVGWAFAIAMTGVGLGFVLESYSWLLRKIDHPLFKLIIAVLSVMAAATATGASAAYVASATGQDPANFKSTITFLAPLAFVPLLAIVLMIASMFGVLVVLLFGLGAHVSKKSDPNFVGLLMMGRILGLVGFSAGVGMILDPSMRVDTGLQAIAAHSAYFLDMQPNRDCAPTPGDHVKRISDEFIIVGRITSDGPRFNRQRCPLEASADPLPPPAPRRDHKTTQLP